MATIVLFTAITACLVAVALRGGFVPARYMCWILIAEALVHLLKRAIFLIGPQSTAEYYSAQGILAGAIVVGCVLGLSRMSRIQAGVRQLILFTVVGLLTTAFGGEPMGAKAASVVDFIFPALVFPVALLISPDKLGKIAKFYIALLALAVPYATYQFFAGPSFLDRAWALGAGDSSTQAGFVLQALDGTLRDLFRPYAFYADPLNFGLVAVASFGVIAAAAALGKLNRATTVAGLTLSVIAALLTLGRSPSLGIISTLAIYQLLSYRFFRKPAVLLAIFVATFLFVNVFSQYLSENYADLDYSQDNAVASRFETIGTLTDRSHSLELFRELLSPRNLLGRGYAYSRGSSSRGFDVEDTQLMGSHNIVIGIMLATGLPGAILISLFLGSIIRDGLAFAAMAGARAKAMKWLAASVLGHLIVGLISGHGVLDMHFYMIAGILAGGGRFVAASKRQAASDRHSVRELQQLAVGS